MTYEIFSTTSGQTLGDVEITVRCRPWTGSPLDAHRVMVSADAVRVWNPLESSYTLLHSLSAGAQRRIRRAARQAVAS